MGQGHAIAKQVAVPATSCGVWCALAPGVYTYLVGLGIYLDRAIQVSSHLYRLVGTCQNSSNTWYMIHAALHLRIIQVQTYIHPM